MVLNKYEISSMSEGRLGIRDVKHIRILTAWRTKQDLTMAGHATKYSDADKFLPTLESEG